MASQPNPDQPRIRDGILIIHATHRGGSSFVANLVQKDYDVMTTSSTSYKGTEVHLEKMKVTSTEYNIDGANRSNPEHPDHFPVFETVETIVKKKIVTCRCDNPDCKLMPRLCKICLKRPAMKKEVCAACKTKYHTK